MKPFLTVVTGALLGVLIGTAWASVVDALDPNSDERKVGL